MYSTVFVAILIVSCHGDSEFNSMVRNFSIELIQSTGLDHVAVGTFGVWSVMASAAIWTYGESQDQFSNSVIPTTNKSNFFAEYEKLRKEIHGSDGANIEFANFVFINKDFVTLPTFRQTLSDHFGAIIHYYDFENSKATSKEANYVIESAARSFLNVLHPDDFTNSSMIMANVMAFRGFWKLRFNVSHTNTETFYDNKINEQREVRMMHQKVKVPHMSIPEMKADVMELAFGNDGKYSMLLIMPHSGVKIKDAYKNFKNIQLVEIVDKLEINVKEVGLKEIDLKLPRLRITANVVLNKPLQDIGVSEVFQTDHSQFSGITTESIYISTVEHHVDFAMSESGVDFKISTPGYADYLLGSSTLEASEPFIFFILEKPTTTILLGGLYSKARYN